MNEPPTPFMERHALALLLCALGILGVIAGAIIVALLP